MSSLVLSSLSVCLRVMLCVMLCVGVHVCLWCGLWCVVVAVALRVSIENVPACTFKTSLCAGTHGDVSNVHTGTFSMDTRRAGGVIVSSAYQNFAHVGLSRASEVHQRNPTFFPIFKFKNRSRTTCSPFLQSFALPDKVVQLQLS